MVMKITPEDLSALREYNDYISEIIKKAADRAARETVRQLTRLGRVTYVPSSSYQKTEQMLYLFPKLPEDHPQRQRILQAMERIREDEYFGIIQERYFDGRTIAQIAEIYGSKYQTISKKRTKLVRILASELFPEDVLDEILGEAD